MVNLPAASVEPLPPAREPDATGWNLTITRRAGAPSMLTVPVTAYRCGSEEHPGTATERSRAGSAIRASRAKAGIPFGSQLDLRTI
jgi:hypothetical protein